MATRSSNLRLVPQPDSSSDAPDPVNLSPTPISGSESASSNYVEPGASFTARAAQTMTIQDLANGLVLVYPLHVSVEPAGGEWFATSPDLALAGRGESDLDALDDLRAQVGELYESLIEMRDSLGSHLRRQLVFLDRLAGR